MKLSWTVVVSSCYCNLFLKQNTNKNECITILAL